MTYVPDDVWAPDDVLGRDTMVRELMRPLHPFLLTEGATEVVINRAFEVFVEVGANWGRFAAPSLSHDRLLALANAIATFTDQEIGPQKPILSAMLPDGERIQIVVPPAVEPDTVSISIRLPARNIKSLDRFEREGAFNRYIWARPLKLAEGRRSLSETDSSLIDYLESNQLASFFQLATVAKKNIAIIGETGSGKTTLMTSLCQSIPTHERLITIEDVREISLPNHPNRVHLLYSKGVQGVAKVTPSDLIAANMRMKPDRVLLAELRGSEAFDFLKLLTTGHSGSITSFHAESCALALDRYVFMCKEHAEATIFTSEDLKRLVELTLDIIVHVAAKTTYDADNQLKHKARFVTEVSFDPIAKLKARFKDCDAYQAGDPSQSFSLKTSENQGYVAVGVV